MQLDSNPIPRLAYPQVCATTADISLASLLAALRIIQCISEGVGDQPSFFILINHRDP